MRAELTAEIAAAGLDGRRWLSHANLKAAPLGDIRGLNGEDVLLPQLRDERRGDHDGLHEVGGEHELSSRPFRKVAEVGAG